MCKLLRCTAAVAALLLVRAVAVQGVILGVTVDPPYPSTREPIHLTATGQGPFYPETLAATVEAADGFGSAGTIRLVLEAFPVTPPPWSLPFAQTVIVGPLPAGIYNVKVESGTFLAQLEVRDFHPVPINSLFLAHQRFEATVAWHTATAQGNGLPEALTDGSGYFWFFDPTNPELLVKMVDGTAVNGHFWVFLGGLSDVAYTVKITDRYSGAERTYTNASGALASRADTAAF